MLFGGVVGGARWAVAGAPEINRRLAQRVKASWMGTYTVRNKTARSSGSGGAGRAASSAASSAALGR